MAAVVGQKLGALASQTSERLGEATTKFRGDHKESCGGIESMCAGFGAFLTAICLSLRQTVSSSFFPYLFTTFALNIPPFAFGLASVFSEQCNSNWLIFNAFLSAMHMMVSVYTVHRIREDAPEEKEANHYVQADSDSATRGAPNSWERIKLVMCYDMVMATYYILFIFWVIWQGIGIRHIFDEEVDASCLRWVVYSVICGFLYMGLGALAWTGSLCFIRYYKLSEQKKGASRKAVLAMDDNGRVELV